MPQIDVELIAKFVWCDVIKQPRRVYPSRHNQCQLQTCIELQEKN